MKRTLNQKDASSVVGGMLDRIRSLSALNHTLTQGQLKEFFVSKVLKAFLTSQFDIGTGVVINHRGDQSRQMDVVIYDNRILPPFIKEQAIGVYPAESVLAVLEIKSSLRKKDLLSAESSAKDLCQRIYDPKGFYPQNPPFVKYKPLCGVIGFYGAGCKELLNEEEGLSWLNKNIRQLFLVCITGKYCWGRVGDPLTWRLRRADSKTHEETKKFIALLLDNIRTWSELRYHTFVGGGLHKDWLSIYLRDQKEIRDYFEK